MEVCYMSPDMVIANSNGAEMQVNPIKKTVQVYGNHPGTQTTQSFNKLLRELGVDMRIVYSGNQDNKLKAVPLEDVI